MHTTSPSPAPAAAAASPSDTRAAARRSAFARQYSRFDRMMAGYEARLIAAAGLEPGERVIDVGCGAGTTSLDAARAVGPSGSAVGFDTNADVLSVARERAADAGLTQLRFEQADATRYAFEPGAVDAVVSRFGTLHFPDLVAGYAHLRAALAPAGRLTFVCGGEQAKNLWATVPKRVLFGLLGAIPDGARSVGGPFVLGDPQLVRSILRDAGYSSVELVTIDDDVCVGADVDDALEFFFEADGDKLAPLLEKVGYARAADALREALTPYASERGVWMPASARLVRARA